MTVTAAPWRARGAALAGVVLLLGACGDQTATSDDFVGRTYAATGVVENAQPLDKVPDTDLLLTFTGDSVVASAGCNQLSGPGGIDAGILRVELLTTTEIACEPAVMAQEEWWAQFLQSEPAADVGDRALTLRTQDASVVMDSIETVPDLPLDGTVWELDTLINGGTAATVPVTSTLLLDAGTLTVLVGECRATTVPVTQSPTMLQFDPAPFEEQPCDGEDAAVDAAVSAVFSGGEVAYRIEADRLAVSAAEKALGYRGA